MIVDHPEFVLDAPDDRAGAPVVIGRPEALPRQLWKREARGDGFVFRSVAHGRPLCVHGGRVVLGDDQHAEIFKLARNGGIWASGSKLFLDIDRQMMGQNVPAVMAQPNNAPSQKWWLWTS